MHLKFGMNLKRKEHMKTWETYIYGTYVFDYIWNIYGTYMNYIWNIYVIYREHICKTYMLHIYFIYNLQLYMEYIWSIYEIYMEHI